VDYVIQSELGNTGTRPSQIQQIDQFYRAENRN